MANRSSSRADLKLLENFWREPVLRSVLPNGLTVLLKPDAGAPVASVQVWVKTGSIHEGEHLGAGLSHYLEHLLFKGTTTRAGREIAATVQAHGGDINAYTTFDRTVYYIDLPAKAVDVAIELLADMVLRSTLPGEEVIREKDVILREIAMGQDDPDQRLGEALFETAFRNHPYRYPIIGHREVFAATTREELLAYYRQRYAPNNLVVVVAGDINPAATDAVIRRHFGEEPRRRLAPVLVPAESSQLAARALHRHEEVEVSRVGLAWPIPGLTHADAPALDVLATVLGAGDSSLLWQEIRERCGLVHSIDATSWNPGDLGLFYISLTCEPAKREAATEAVLAALQRWSRRGLTPAMLRKAMRQLMVGEINSRRTMSGQASRLGLAEVVVGDLDYGRAYFRQLTDLTTADLRRAITAYLVPDRLTTVSLNPKQTTAAGPVRAETTGKLADFEEILLPNGARILLQPHRRLPNLHLRISCLGGALHESPGRRGATALLATMLTKDTRRRSAAAVARFIEEVGGTFSAFAGNNSFGLATEVLSSEADRALTVLADAVLEPAFRAGTFKIEREAQLAALRLDNDEVVTRGRRLLRQKFFGRHPLAVEPQGDEAGVAALTIADLKAMHARLLVPGNIVLSVAGDFDRAKLLPRLRAFLGRLPRGGEVGSTVRFEPPPAEDFLEIQPKQQAVVYEAYPAPALRAPDFYVGEVADELFSGMSSRLFERVREEKGLAYFVRSARVIGTDAGMFYFLAGTAPGSEGAVQAEITAEIARLAAGQVEPAELQRCQVRLKAGRLMSLQTNAARAAQAGLNAIYGLPRDEWQNYGARVDAVTVADLARFAREYLRPDRRVRLVVRP
ncbi:MAG TPA: pitrilysin family protein [Opitutaceae bacterium]|nr:pitrilysin family protein [Opitutaceae bacterium]